MANVRSAIYIGLPVLILGYLVYGRVQAVAAQEAREQEAAGARRNAAPSVEVATAGPATLVESVETVGTLVSESAVDLSPRVSGQITFLEVREGDSVRPGQVLVRIDPSQADAAVSQNRANVNESLSRLAQAEATILASETQVEQAIQQAQAELASGKASLVQTERAVEARLAAAAASLRQSESTLAQARAVLANRKAEVNAAKARLRTEELRLQRIRSQYEKGYIAAQDVDDAVAAVESVRAETEVSEGEVKAADAAIEAAVAQVASDQTALKAARASGAAEIEGAKARVRQLEAALSSAKSTRAQNPANRLNLQALRAGVDADRAQLTAAQVQKGDTELSSPVAGIVTRRSADPGSLASPGQSILRVEKIDQLFLTASIPVEESARVRAGMPLTATIDGLDSGPIGATIQRVVAAANPADRQFQIQARIANRNGAIRPGMFVRIQVEVGRREARVAVPAEAVQDGRATVVGDDGKAVVRAVEVGKSSRGLVEVLSGIRPGEKVVVLSYNPVRPDAAVKITAERLPDGTRKVIESEAGEKK